MVIVLILSLLLAKYLHSFLNIVILHEVNNCPLWGRIKWISSSKASTLPSNASKETAPIKSAKYESEEFFEQKKNQNLEFEKR